jgi:hypothetical protein
MRTRPAVAVGNAPCAARLAVFAWLFCQPRSRNEKKNELGQPFTLMDHQREILRFAFALNQEFRQCVGLRKAGDEKFFQRDRSFIWFCHCASSLDDIVRQVEDGLRNCETDLFRCFQIDDEIELRSVAPEKNTSLWSAQPNTSR